MTAFSPFPKPLPWAAALLLPLLTSLLTPSRSFPSSGQPSADNLQSPAELSEQTANMNVSNLGEALFLLSSVFISAIQPQQLPKVALQLILPDIGLQKQKLGNFDSLFNSQKWRRVPSAVEVEPLMTWVQSQRMGPGELLHALCNDTFQNNVVTILHINNPKVSPDFREVSGYFKQLMESVGLPVISWDSDYSAAESNRLTLQLAPTMYHQTDAMLAFMKKFSWKYFSMVTTRIVGSEDFFSALRHHQRVSSQQSLPNRYGDVGFEYKILSDVILESGDDKAVIERQLRDEIDPDTRIILLHAKSREAFNILEVAEQIGLTGREYVWMLSATALGDQSDGEVASSSLPLGLFGVSYKSKLEDMSSVIMRAISVWLQALKDLDQDGKLPTWQWDTKLSCNNRQIRKWAGGQLLFDYMLNVTLPASEDGLATEFNDTGMVLFNEVSILNVMPGTSASFTSNPTGPSNRFPSRPGGLPPRRGGYGGVGSSGGLATTGSNRSSSASRGFVYNRGQSGNVNFPARSNSSSSRLSPYGPSSSSSSSSGFSSNRLSHESSSSNNLLSRDREDLSEGLQSPGSSWRDRFGNSGSMNRTSSFTDGTQGKEVRSRTSKDFFETSHIARTASIPDPDIREFLPDRHSRRRKARHRLLRHHRLTRSSSVQKRFQEVAKWDGRGLKIMEIIWPGNSSYPPKGVPEKYHLRVATYVEEPHVTFRPLGEKGDCDTHATRCMVYERDKNDNRYPGVGLVERCCLGLSIDILAKLSVELNFNYSLFEVQSGGYGSITNRSNNAEWIGLVGAVLSKEADIAVAALTITPEREEVLDFSIPFLETGITIVVAIREGAISPTAFLEPYDYPSWTLILVFSVHATGASIFIFEWLSPYGLDQGHTPLRVHKFSLFRSFWLIWAMLFGAAVSTDMPRGVSSRFLANIWALFAVVFLASYTANLAAFMIIKEEYYDLSGIQDWRLKNPHHRHPPFKYATMPDGATETNIMKNHPDLYVHMKKYPQHTVKEAIVALKKQEIQAFIYDATTLEYAVGKDDKCKLKSVGQRYAETGYGVGFPKKSRWVKKFNEVLLRMRESGEIERLQKFWLAGACHKKTQQRGSSSHTLDILNFTSAFILLGGGVVLGALLLMLEHVYFRFGRESLRKWDKCGCCSLVSLSMGQSLTFEQSVMEAIDMHKHHKCRDPLCETQLWKAKHELDIALLRIDQLKRLLARQTAEDGNVGGEGHGEGGAVWTYDPEATRQKDGIPRKRAAQTSVSPASREKKEPLLVTQRNGIESVATALLKSPGEEKSQTPIPSSPQSDSEQTPPRTSGPRRTRFIDGKIYENVDGGIDIESTI